MIFLPIFLIVSSERIVAIQVEQFSFFFYESCAQFMKAILQPIYMQYTFALRFYHLPWSWVLIIPLEKALSWGCSQAQPSQQAVFCSGKAKAGPVSRQLWGPGLLCDVEGSCLELGVLDSKPTLHPHFVILAIYAPLLSVCSLVAREWYFLSRDYKVELDCGTPCKARCKL